MDIQAKGEVKSAAEKIARAETKSISHDRQEREKERLTQLPDDVEDYRGQELSSRLQTARTLLARHAEVEDFVDMDDSRSAHAFEAGVEGHPTLKADVIVGYRRGRLIAPGKGKSERAQDGVAGIVVVLQSPSLSYLEALRPQYVIFGRKEVDGETVDDVQVSNNGLLSSEPIDPEQHSDLIAMIDEACTGIIEGPLAEQRQALGATATDSSVEVEA